MKPIFQWPNLQGPVAAGLAGWVSMPGILAGLLLIASCGKPSRNHPTAQAELTPARVRIRIVESKPVAAVEEVVGTVQARLRATIEAKISGRIADLPVVLGQKIRKGELLARLDAPEIKARLDQAEASLQQAEREWKRTSSLFSQQAASRADYDAADARYLVAKGVLAEARAMTGDLDILAPFDGVVTKTWADVGDLAAPGKPLLDLEDPTRLQLEADVPEALASKIERDARLMIRVDQGMPDLAATVAVMSPTADPASRTFRVKLDLAASPGLMPGQFARLLVPVGETASLRVPASAVVQRGQMEIVFAVKNRLAGLRLVKTGRRVNDEIEILSGLDSGDLVVIDHPRQLVDGQPVRGE